MYLKDSPRKIQVKVNLLESQVQRIEHQINVLINMSISAQHIVDTKKSQIKYLEDKRKSFGK